jgi:hypothetical protein
MFSLEVAGKTQELFERGNVPRVLGDVRADQQGPVRKEGPAERERVADGHAHAKSHRLGELSPRTETEDLLHGSASKREGSEESSLWVRDRGDARPARL